MVFISNSRTESREIFNKIALASVLFWMIQIFNIIFRTSEPEVLGQTFIRKLHRPTHFFSLSNKGNNVSIYKSEDTLWMSLLFTNRNIYKSEQKPNDNVLIGKKKSKKDMWIKFKWCRLLGRSSTLPITGHISIIQSARLFFTQGWHIIKPLFNSDNSFTAAIKILSHFWILVLQNQFQPDYSSFKITFSIYALMQSCIQSKYSRHIHLMNFFL